MPIEEEQTIDLVSSPENIPPVMAENLTISTTSENFAKKRTRKAKKPENQKVINVKSTSQSQQEYMVSEWAGGSIHQKLINKNIIEK